MTAYQYKILIYLAIFSMLLGQATVPGHAQAQAKPASTAASESATLAPLPAKPAPVSTHAPYAAGDCKICHQRSDASNPGALLKPAPELCLGCHDEFASVLKRRYTHAPASASCTLCHNPHNARQPKLVRAELRALCTNCHAKIKDAIETAKVKHGAMATAAQCVSCHNPHASPVARLLLQQPLDLCMNCHNQDALVDADGRKLQNMKSWLDANKNWHGPLLAKDCSGCHEPHGGNRFRMLKEDYTREFYAPYNPRNYALCFSCHNEKAYSTPDTTTLTGFRDGAKNLHYTHLQQGDRGRTCRACHEVHASSQSHHIREGVPYGSSGWVLKLHFRKSETGGSCEKTCHQERSYSNRAGR